MLKAYLHGGEQLQIAMMDALFAAYFEEERDIGCIDNLSAAAERAGLMDQEKVSSYTSLVFPCADQLAQAQEFLASDFLKEEVRMLQSDAELKNIKSVPLTIINNRLCIQGAMQAKDFLEVSSLCAAARPRPSY